MLLKLGSRGNQVVELQRLLNAAGANPRLEPDGDFGPRTDAAVRAFQASHTDANGRRLLADGEVGEKTWWALTHQQRPQAEPPRTHTTGGVGQRIVRIAMGEAERGVREHGGENTGADVRMYQRATGLGGTGWPWCAAFVTWCYESAGLTLNNAAGFASVALMESWARRSGRWHGRVRGYTPPAGSIVIFTFSHTGIVVSGGDTSDITVEGNTSAGNRGSQRNGDGVYQRTRSHSIIKGYVVLEEILR